MPASKQFPASPENGRTHILKALAVNADTDLTLSHQLKQQLTWLIASGQIKAGHKLPTMRDVASHLGINLHTVRAAYRKLEADGLVVMRPGSGTIALPFDRVQFARQTTRTRSYAVGLIVSNINHPFYTALVQGVEGVAREHHALLFICNTDEDSRAGKEYLDLLIAKQVDGIILASYGLRFGKPSVPPDSRLTDSPVPIVHVDRPGEAGYGVVVDFEGAGHAATTHLLDHGHRRIGFITCSVSTDRPGHEPIDRGYERALAAAGVSLDRNLIGVTSAFNIAAGYEAAQPLLNVAARPTAILAADDTLALGAMQAAKERGLRIPEDIALIGLNDIDIGAMVDPPLTSVAAPARDVGAAAMHMLQRLIVNEPVTESQVTLPTRLVVRRSCGCQSGSTFGQRNGTASQAMPKGE